MLIDTHCHLASHRYQDSDIPGLIENAVAAGVDRMITIGTDLVDSKRNIELAEAHPEVFAAAGIHPTSVHEIEAPDWLDQIRSMMDHPRVVALGEIGMDFFHPAPEPLTEEAYRSRQADFFRAQLDLAVELSLPVVIHQRNSFDAIMEIMEPYHEKICAVFHCFSGNTAEARHLIDLGHFVSFTGIVTYKSAANVQEAARELALSDFMVETDAPYLAPVPHRGQKCEPAFTRHTAEFIAQLRGIPLDELAATTTTTAETFFRIP